MHIESGHFASHITTHLPYKLYLPPAYDPASTQTYPLLLFLHGAGERGHDLRALVTQGLPKKLEAGDDLPFIVLAPQCPPDDWWASHSKAVIALLDSVMHKHAVDDGRVYLTGLSMGGFGTWHIASDYPDRFMAIAPICGFPGHPLQGYPQRLARMTHMPVWAFHGEQDDVVPLSAHKYLVDALREMGGTVRWTTYPDADHDSWTVTYDNPELYDWFLTHQR